MYPRVNYEMSEDDLKELLTACRPTPCMMVGGYAPSTPQENANRAWEALGKKMGFDYETVQPIKGKGTRCFSAVPSETEDQRKSRIADEQAKRIEAEKVSIKSQIEKLQKRLDEINGQKEETPCC